MTIVFSSCLPGLIFYPITSGRDNYLPFTGTFKMTTCDRLHPDFKIRTIANTDGMGNCLLQPGQPRNRPQKSM